MEYEIIHAMEIPSLVGVSQMLLQVLGHAKALLALLAKHWLHGLVRSEPLAILLVLKIFLLQVRPQLLHNLGSRNLFSFLGANDLGQGGRDVQGLLNPS